jgi:hypothetical protein
MDDEPQVIARSWRKADACSRTTSCLLLIVCLIGLLRQNRPTQPPGPTGPLGGGGAPLPPDTRSICCSLSSPFLAGAGFDGVSGSLDGSVLLLMLRLSYKARP